MFKFIHETTFVVQKKKVSGGTVFVCDWSEKINLPVNMRIVLFCVLFHKRTETLHLFFHNTNVFMQLSWQLRYSPGGGSGVFAEICVM